MLSVRAIATRLPALAAAAWVQISRVTSCASHQPNRVARCDKIYDVVEAGDKVVIMDQINRENFGGFDALGVEIREVIRLQRKRVFYGYVQAFGDAELKAAARNTMPTLYAGSGSRPTDERK